MGNKIVEEYFRIIRNKKINGELLWSFISQKPTVQLEKFPMTDHLVIKFSCKIEGTELDVPNLSRGQAKYVFDGYDFAFRDSRGTCVRKEHSYWSTGVRVCDIVHPRNRSSERKLDDDDLLTKNSLEIGLQATALEETLNNLLWFRQRRFYFPPPFPSPPLFLIVH